MRQRQGATGGLRSCYGQEGGSAGGWSLRPIARRGGGGSCVRAGELRRPACRRRRERGAVAQRAGAPRSGQGGALPWVGHGERGCRVSRLHAATGGARAISMSGRRSTAMAPQATHRCRSMPVRRAKSWRQSRRSRDGGVADARSLVTRRAVSSWRASSRRPVALLGSHSFLTSRAWSHWSRTHRRSLPESSSERAPSNPQPLPSSSCARRCA